MNHSNSYNEFNSWISGIIANAKDGKKINVNKIIKMASRLPSPDTPEKYANLIDSGLCYSFDELAFLLGNSYKQSPSDIRSIFVDHGICDSSTELSSKFVNSFNPSISVIRTKSGKKDTRDIFSFYLNELWKVWEKYFLKYGFEDYVSLLIESDKYRKKESAFKAHYHSITHPDNKCYNPDCENHQETLEYNEFYLKHSSKFLALSRTSLIGCEGFVHACLRLKNDQVFSKIWNHWKAPDISRIQLSWLPFITCAGELKCADILREIWDSIRKSYKKIHFYTTIFLLNSAYVTKVNEINEYFNVLNTPSCWDISASYNPYLDSLSSIFSFDQNFKSTMKLEYRSFEGKFWTLYFKQLFEQNTENVKKLFDEYRSILRFKDKDSYEWHSTFCLAQETYARELRSRLYIELQNQFSYLNSIEENILFRKIVNGNLSAQIKKYQNMVSQILSKSIKIPMTDEVIDYKFVPFIDFFLSNHMSFVKNRENFFKWQNDDEFKSSFFKKAEKYLKVIKRQKVAEQDWLYFLYLLLSQIRKNIDNFYSEIFLSEIHSMKRLFVKNFEIPLQGVNPTSREKYELVQKAKRFLLDISRRLPSYRIMEPKKVNITPEIDKHLLKDYYETKESILPCDYHFYIAGYDGIFEDYLRPILIETRSNAEKALSQIPKEERHYQVNLKYGKNDFSGYGILSVTNNFAKNDKNKSLDPISTGIGLKNIQYYATFFQQGAKQGWAQFKTESRKKYNFFITNIFFPLWEESFEEKITYV